MRCADQTSPRASAPAVLGSERAGTTMPMYWNAGPNWADALWMGFWTVLWVALLGLVLWGVMRLLARRPDASSAHAWRIQSDEPSALEILNRRYARGELDAE